MVFHRLHCLISSKIVNEVADDIITIAELSTDKDQLRNAMLMERLKSSNQNSMLTAYDISEMIRSLSPSYIKPQELCVVIKRINRRIRKHYQFISNVVNLIGGDSYAKKR